MNGTDVKMKLLAIAGYKVIDRFFDDMHRFETDTELVESVINESPYSFYVDRKSKYLFSFNSMVFQKKYGELKEIKPIEAFRQFGIDKMDVAIIMGVANV